MELIVQIGAAVGGVVCGLVAGRWVLESILSLTFGRRA